MTIFNNEQITKEPMKVGKEFDQKKIITFTSASITGLTIAEIISKYSPIVDKIIFKSIPNYLASSDIAFMGYFAIPNWFIVVCVIGYLVIAFATIKNNLKELKK